MMTVLPSRPRVTPAMLRAEGIVDMGCAAGTSVLFVLTRERLHVFHTESVPDRTLDSYAIALAVTWIEDHGLPSWEVARNLGVSWPTLRHALAQAGYERLSAAKHEQLAHARMARKLGNRRGRLARVGADAS